MTTRLRLSGLALIVANLAPLAGVLMFDWSIGSIIILYWFENVVIGCLNVARMALASPVPERVPGIGLAVVAMHGFKLLLIPFFVFHYFFFCAIHGVFVFSLFPDHDGYFADPEGFSLLGTLGNAIAIFATPLALAALALALSHLVSFGINYLGNREYERADLRQLMGAPYNRIVVLHLTIIFGGMATQMLGQPLWLVVVFVAIKIGVDLKMHVAEHVKASQGAVTPPA